MTQTVLTVIQETESICRPLWRESLRLERLNKVRENAVPSRKTDQMSDVREHVKVK